MLRELKKAFNSTIDVIACLILGMILGVLMTTLSIKVSCESKEHFTIFKTTYECMKND